MGDVLWLRPSAFWTPSTALLAVSAAWSYKLLPWSLALLPVTLSEAFWKVDFSLSVTAPQVSPGTCKRGGKGREDEGWGWGGWERTRLDHAGNRVTGALERLLALLERGLLAVGLQVGLDLVGGILAAEVTSAIVRFDTVAGHLHLQSVRHVVGIGAWMGMGLTWYW